LGNKPPGVCRMQGAATCEIRIIIRVGKCGRGGATKSMSGRVRKREML
jgi:hypothetical protein